MANNIIKKLQLLLLTFILAFGQTALAIGPFTSTGTATALVDCVVDTAGANDEPGQKDLTQLCIDDTNSPTSIDVSWGWDETKWTGANTGDACALFDTDGDGFVNYSICVSIDGDPAEQVAFSPRVFSCGDDKIDRCTSPSSELPAPYASTCDVDQQDTDPFATGDEHPTDTVAECTLVLSDVGGAIAELVDVCSFPSLQPGSDPSDCIIIKDRSAKLELIKHLDPTTDEGLFDLSIDGTEYATDVGHNGTTGQQVIDVGNNGASIVFAETAGTNTSLTSYNTVFECRDQNGSGDVVAEGERDGAGSRQISVDVEAGTDIVCVVTNTRQQATLILQKTVINDDGGTLTQADFPVQIDGNTAQWGSNTVSPDTYVVSETTQTGYAASVWGGDCDAAGNVTLADGETKTCTITNDDIAPELTVIKNVINDDGGDKVASNFTMNVSGTDVSDTSFAGSETGVTVTLDAGAYTAGETELPGYSASYSTDCSGTIAIGETKTCTITNDDDAPGLTIVKNVITDNGGTAVAGDFTLHLSGGDYTGDEDFSTGNTPSVDANTEYTLSEDAVFGYQQTNIGCTDDDTQQAVAHPVSLAPGQNVTCTITNDDIAPKLTVIKIVDNEDYNGQLNAGDFPLFVDDLQVDSGVQNEFNAGNYDITETQQDGYEFVDYSGDCLSDGSITMVVGGVYTCTLTNKALPVTIKVTKQVTNDNGGTAGIEDFELYVNDTQVTSGASNTFAGNVEYTVSELALVDGYEQTSLSCTDQDQTSLGATFTPANGDAIECVIVNDDKAPVLTLIKNVVNDYGQADDANDWTLSATPEFNLVGATTVSGDGNPFDGDGVDAETVFAGVGYQLAEADGHTGYTASNWVCNGGDQDGDELTLSLGDDVTCTITNRAIAPQLIVIKEVINDNGGNQDAGDFTMQVSATNPTQESFPGQADPGTTVTVDEGEYEVTETEQLGYTASYSEDCVGTIAIGETKTCTITNDDEPGTITVIKNIDIDGDNQADEQDVDTWLWTIDDSLPFVTGSSNPQTVDAGSYLVSEVEQDGYSVVGVSCGERQDGLVESTSIEVQVANGEDVVCTFLNQRDVVLNLTKSNDSPVADNGDTVTYTLEVSVPETSGVSHNTCVTDLPPEGFAYNGAWTANSSMAHDVEGDVNSGGQNCGEEGGPSYESPGHWFIGTLQPGEIVTLTYQTVIGDTVFPGTYPDVAFAAGCSQAATLCPDDNVVYSNVSGGNEDPFVSTDVTIEGAVLGASTVTVTRLVDTGDSLTQVYALLAAMLLAGGLVAARAQSHTKGGQK